MFFNQNLLIKTMWFCGKLSSATFFLALIASVIPCFSVSVFTNTNQSYQRNSVGNLNYGVIKRTSEIPEARFFNFNSFARLGSYFSRFYNYFEEGMNLLWNYDELIGRPRPKKVNYKRHQLLRVVPRTDLQVDDVLALRDEVGGLMYWTEPAKNHSTDILVPPDLVYDVKEFLKLRGLDFFVLLKDVQKLIAAQNPKLTREQRLELRSARGHEMTFKRYHRYGDMLRYLEYLSSKYPELVEILTIGKSTQENPLKVVKVSNGQRAKNGEPKPAIWIDGEIPQFSKLTTDGFGKIRTLARFFWGEPCRGVDMNRNWNFHWGEAGASNDLCHETYAGPRPFSEPETRAISDFIMDRKDRIKLFLTMHSYSQMWLVPWGYTYKKSGDYEDLMNMGRKAVDALTKVSGTAYQLGSSTSLLYPTSGGSDDWAKGAAGIKYAYTVELRDDGTYGFLLPASQIVPTGKETFAAIKAIVRAIVCKN